MMARGGPVGVEGRRRELQRLMSGLVSIGRRIPIVGVGVLAAGFSLLAGGFLRRI